MPLVLTYPQIDPVAISLGPLSIKWYGIAYMAGLILGWLYIRALLRNHKLWPNGQAPFSVYHVDDLLILITAGVIIGGRLGSVLLYEPSRYINAPLDIFKIWQGGMAFHGALIGCGVGAWIFARKKNVNLWSTMDLCAAAVPIGLFFGRVANFINAELFGRPTELPWGMVFPNAGRFYPDIAHLEPTPRHPSQLYEAALEGILLFLVLRFLTHKQSALKKPGTVVAAFLIGYGILRSIGELFRQPDPAHALTVLPLTPGIAYSIPMIVLGIYFLKQVRQENTQ